MRESAKSSALAPAVQVKLSQVNHLLTTTILYLERLEELSKLRRWNCSVESELFVNLEYLETTGTLTLRNLKFLVSSLTVLKRFEESSRSM